MSSRLFVGAACAVLTAVATPRPPAVAAQEPAPPARPYVGQTLATNPLALPFGFVSGEYERALGRGGFAVGAGGYATFADANTGSGLDAGERWASFQAKLKYYPAQNGLRGFAVGLTAGVVRASRPTYAYAGGCYDAVCALDVTSGGILVGREVFSAPTLGATLDYNLFLGPRRRFLVGFGAGARRALRGDAYLGPISSTMVDGRLQIGVGF